MTTNIAIGKENALAIAKATNDTFDLFDLTEFADLFVENRHSSWYASGKTYQCIFGDTNSGTWTPTAPGVGLVPLATDLITVVYNNCQQDPMLSDRLNGTLVIQLTSVSGNPASFTKNSPWSYGADVTFKKLEVTTTARHHVIDGQISIQIGARGLGTQQYADINDLKITSPNIHIKKDADTHEFSNVTMMITQDHTVSIPTFQATVNANLTSSTLNGRIDIQTITPFLGSGATDYPSNGYAKILGAAGTSLDFRPGAGDSVTLTINDGGRAPASINSSWAELDHD